MLQRLMCRMGLALLLAALAAAASAQDVGRIRLMLHPYAAPPGVLPSEALAKLQAVAGVPLALSATTRTGGLEFTLGQTLSPADAKSLLRSFETTAACCGRKRSSRPRLRPRRSA